MGFRSQKAGGMPVTVLEFLRYPVFFFINIRHVACAILLYSRREWAGAKSPVCISIIVAVEC